ncbi:hypothetical protein F4778DRAFT_731062 [Xylariomycetidae sp. FL2044]|nr:hypothetical protein F4778DRAFT_731062 [Xylariomycetidae sp. FL2044]
MSIYASKEASLRPPGGPADAAYGGLDARDPRSSSTQSLVPSISDCQHNERRKLLVVYIHGFMGNDSSFQSFPAHVHKYLKLALSDTHVIHSKIYPRYKTYKAIEVARDTFSRWLRPHENANTDVILVGHSMGGLLCADVVLMPSSGSRQDGYFRHRILGTVNLDAPFLGLHPGIIVAGISSLFRKKDTPQQPGGTNPQAGSSQELSGVASSSNSFVYADLSPTSQISSPMATAAMTFDPHFNPQFSNDVIFQDRGWWKNVVHFVKKHNSEGLVDAATKHIMSHMEFGSCLLDISCLKNRYENVRKLEDIDDYKQYGFPHIPPQVRFIQYYTVCHGYPKKPKQQDSEEKIDEPNGQNDRRNSSVSSSNPTASVKGHEDTYRSRSLKNMPKEDPVQLDGFVSDGSDLDVLDPIPLPEEGYVPEKDSSGLEKTINCEESTTTNLETENDGTKIVSQPTKAEAPQGSSSSTKASGTLDLTESVSALDLDLPPIQELPPRPDPPDLSQLTDKDARKQAEKEAKREQKAYDQAVKQREKAIKERQKIVEKRKKKRAQEIEKQGKEEKKRRQKEEEAASKLAAEAMAQDHTDPSETDNQTMKYESSDKQAPLDSRALSPLPTPLEEDIDSQQQRPRQHSKDTQEKQKKDRKFCNLPHKVNGQVDPRWIRIFMKDTDEVGAHTGLFFPAAEHYEKLIGDVGETIVGWVQEDMTKRAILEMGS